MGVDRSEDLAVVSALLRLRLMAQRAGLPLRIRCGPRLGELVECAGLSDLVEVRRETEAGEEPRVEEVVDVGDLPA